MDRSKQNLIAVFLALAALLTSCASRVTEPPADPLATQHALSRAMDSLNRAQCLPGGEWTARGCMYADPPLPPHP